MHIPILIPYTTYRSNQDKIVGSLLSDINRLNVSLTRAKSKLIMVGNIETLVTANILSSLIDILRAKSWVHEISRDDYEIIVNEIGGKSKIDEWSEGVYDGLSKAISNP